MTENKELSLINDNNTSSLTIMIKEWDAIMENRNEWVINSESSVDRCDANVNKCPCSQRVLISLKLYSFWLNGKKDKHFDTLFSQLNKYSISSLINDFMHLKKHHSCNNNDMLNYFNDNLKCNNECDTNIVKRHYRNRDECLDSEKRRLMYFRFVESKCVVTCQIFDSIHTYLLHSYQIKNISILSQNMYTNDDDCDDIKLDIDIINDDTTYDKIIDDILNENIIRPHKFITNNRMIAKKTSKYYENIKFELRNDIYAVVLNDESMGHFFNYWDKKSLDKNYYYVRNKYINLKLELVGNKIYRLTLIEWDDIILKCQYLMKTEYIKKLTSKNVGLWNKICGIYPGQPFTLEYCIVAYIYANYVEFVQKFKLQFIRFVNETKPDFIKRHRYLSLYYFWIY